MDVDNFIVVVECVPITMNEVGGYEERYGTTNQQRTEGTSRRTAWWRFL
jgi:hypothetical protein